MSIGLTIRLDHRYKDNALQEIRGFISEIQGSQRFVEEEQERYGEDDTVKYYFRIFMKKTGTIEASATAKKLAERLAHPWDRDDTGVLDFPDPTISSPFIAKTRSRYTSNMGKYHILGLRWARFEIVKDGAGDIGPLKWLLQDP